ncbi:MAG: flagellar protein FlaG [Pseudomonadota bacterium]
MPTDVTMQTATTNAAGSTKKNVVIASNKVVDRQDVSAKEESLPPASESSLSSEENLSDTASTITKYVQNMQRDLHFSVDENSGETVIKVVESETQRLVRTIPSEEFLRAAREFNQTVGMLLNAKA